MRKALVRRDLQRLFQVEDVVFSVAPPMEWIDCADNVKPETHNFDGTVFAAKPPAPPGPDLSDINNLDKVLKSLGLLMRDYCNQLKAGTYVNKSVPDLRNDFMAKYNSLP